MSGSDDEGEWLEWATAGRPMPGESATGDVALRLSLAGGDLVATVDGLGHGPEAAQAAARACEVVTANAGEPLDDILHRCHDALARTRGVAMTIASLGRDGVMRWVGVGNVEAHLVRQQGLRGQRMASAILFGGVVGYRLPRLRVSTVELTAGDVVLMATDGIAPQFLDELAVADPVDRMAATIVDRWARATDDALVAAARFRGPA
jgi:phosphoserine phosphatase RsbX